MKKILIPTDFSQVTEKALLVATEFSRKCHAPVELLHIIEAPYEADLSVTGEVHASEGMDNIFILKSIEQANIKMKQIMNDIRYVGVRFIPRIKLGDPHSHFTKQISDEPADLIIMGTDGSHRFLKGIFTNTNAEDVVTHAKCMVLTVKKDLENFRIRNLVFATNFEDDAPEFLEKITELQDVFDFKIHLVYVNSIINRTKDVHKIEKLANDFVKKHKLFNYDFHIQEDWTEYTGIVEFSRKVQADIIALSSHQHSGLHWLGGISEDLVTFAELPILTYKVK